MKRLLLVVLAVIASGCAHSPLEPTPVPVTPPSAAPASIFLATSSRSDYQSNVLAIVYTADRQRVPNIPISFSTQAGTITAQPSTTDANGSATATVSTATTTTVNVTIGILSASVQVNGASAPSPLTPTPPTNPFPDQPPIGTRVVLNAPNFATTGAAVPLGVSASAGGTWVWTFGDGATLSTTAYSIAHTYAAAGSYMISVTGNGGSASAGIIVSDPAPPAPVPAPALTASLTCTPVAHGAPSPCNVSATYGGVLLPSATITNVAWDWGDGTTTATPGPSSTRSYVNAGTYTVFATVTATTIDGPKTATTSKSIVVP